MPPYETFASADLPEQLALEWMLGKLSTRRYGLGLEPVGEQTGKSAKGTSKSAISRRFVAGTAKAL
ncbi:MAG: transposase, partial [Actinomycetia bacterium]|nr:transposase [Actinomycetes bacterium]